MSDCDLNPPPLTKTRTLVWRLRPLGHPDFNDSLSHYLNISLNTNFEKMNPHAGLYLFNNIVYLVVIMLCLVICFYHNSTTIAFYFFILEENLLTSYLFLN